MGLGPLTSRQFWQLVGLTALALAGFIGGCYIIYRIVQ